PRKCATPWPPTCHSRRAWAVRPSTPRWSATSSRTPCSTARSSAWMARCAWPPSEDMKMHNDPVVIVGAARTPMGGFLGDFRELSAAELGAAAIRATLERAGVGGDAVDEALMGCVLQAGQGQAPARQAVLGAGLPQSVVCSTVNKMCGSGMKAAMLGHDLLLAGSAR